MSKPSRCGVIEETNANDISGSDNQGEPTIALTVELIPDLEQGGFTARVPDIPAYGEGETEDEAIDDLREALRGYIEAFGVDAHFRAAEKAVARPRRLQ